MAETKEPWYSTVGKFVGMILGVISLAGAAVSAILFLSGLFELPRAFDEQAKQINSIREDVTNLTAAFNSSRPEVIALEGVCMSSKPVVRQGETQVIVYTLRRNISCDTDIVVRFWSYSRNILDSVNTYTVPATKAPVTSSMIYFPVTVRIPEHLPPDEYSYAPLVKPKDCGIYTDQTLPLSEKFTVIPK